MALTRAQIQTAFQNSLGRAASQSDENSYFSVSQSGALTDAQIFSTISNSREADQIADPVIRFYQAAFGRVPDQAGLANAEAYVRAFTPTAATYQNLSNMFAQSTEFTNRFGTGTAVDAAYVQALYSTILNRSATSAEVDGYVSGAAGYTTRGGVLYAVSQSSEAISISDTAVNGFQLNAAQGQAVYTGSVYTQQNGSTGGTVGTTFALTTGVDTITGTGSNDLIRGDNTTVQASDTINGGAGRDTFSYTDSSTTGVVPTAQFTAVEVINIRNLAGTGSTPAITETAAVGFQALTAGQTVIIAGRTVTAGAGGASAADVATAFLSGNTTPVGSGTATATPSGTLTGYTGAASGTTGATLQSTIAGNVSPDATNSGSGPATVQVTQGSTGTNGAAVVDTINAQLFSGATDFNSDNSTSGVIFNNLAAGQSVGEIGSGTVVGALTGNYVAAATAATINIAGGTANGSGAINIAGNGLTTATINSTGAANTVGGITLAGTVTTLNIAAQTNLTTGGITDAGLTTIAATGNASVVNLGALGAAVTTVNASGLAAGGVTATLDAAITSFTGGQGNDSITTAALTTTTASAINAGAGTADKLVVAAAANVDTAAKAAVYAGFEVIETNGQNVDLALFTNSTINGLRVAGTETVANVNSTVAQNVTVFADGTPTLNVTGATNVGQIDTVKLTFDDGANAVNTLTLGAVNIAGVENLQLVATADKGTISSLAGATSLTSLTVSGSQDVSVTTGALTLNANTTVDASALTGKLTFDATNAAGANGISITSGTGADTITGSANADVINAGAGNNTIVGLAGNDVITAGAGNDQILGGVGADSITAGGGSNKFFYGQTLNGVAGALTDSLAGTTTTVTNDTITGFVAGTDKFIVGTAPTAVTNNATLQANGTGVLSTDVTSALTNGNLTLGGNNAAVITINGGADAGTYVVINNGTDGYQQAADAVIKLVGLTGTLSATDFATA